LPSYEEDRLRKMPDGQLFATITHGVRNMPAYGAQIPKDDRWAIVGYVRALQMSQMTASAAPAPAAPGAPAAPAAPSANPPAPPPEVVK
jgi:hypothetical protein